MNGSVMLALPSDTQADLETKCLNGSFYSELPVTMQSTLNPREMHGRIGNGGPPAPDYRLIESDDWSSHPAFRTEADRDE